jgi:hypothetical protein
MGRRAVLIEDASAEKSSARTTSAEASSAPTVPELTDGANGWRHNWRHGMHGAVRYWARGSRSNVIKMLVGLANDFGVKDEVGQQLDPQHDSIAAERTIARNVKGALAGLKPKGGSNEEQRREYHIVNAAAFGAPAKARDPRGMTAKIGKYLQVPVGARYSKKADGSTEKREYASRKAQTKRAEFDSEVERQSFELGRDPQVGDMVLSRGEQAVLVSFLPKGGCILRLRDGDGDRMKEQHFTALYGSEVGSAHLTMPPLLVKGDTVIAHGDRAELTSLLPNGGCILTFSAANGYSQQKTYRWCFGKAEGSARLQRPPPLLLPDPRIERSDAVSGATRLLVREHAKEVCPVSPCRRDEMQRHIAPRVWETRQVCSPAVRRARPIR